MRDQRKRSAWLWRAMMQNELALAMPVAAQWRQDSVKFEEQTLQSEERERQLLLAQQQQQLGKQATPPKTK